MVPVVKVPILQHLESLRDEELEERREKRRRQLAEEEEAKQSERRASGAEDSREQSLQVSRWREVCVLIIPKALLWSLRSRVKFHVVSLLAVTFLFSLLRVLDWGWSMAQRTLQVD